MLLAKDNFFNTHITMCIVNNKKKVYSACAEYDPRVDPATVYDPSIYKYIGTGYIYSIDGVRQVADGEYFFYQRRVTKDSASANNEKRHRPAPKNRKAKSAKKRMQNKSINTNK